MAKKKVTTNYFWNIVCFVALALFATRAFFGIFNLSLPWLGMFENITNIIIGVVVLISAWNAVAGAKKRMESCLLDFCCNRNCFNDSAFLLLI